LTSATIEKEKKKKGVGRVRGGREMGEGRGKFEEAGGGKTE